MTAEEQQAIDAAIREARRSEEDDDAYWAAVERVQNLGGREVFEQVRRLAESSEPVVRALAADVLRSFGETPWSDKEGPKPAFRDETIALFGQVLRTEEDARVIASVGFANDDLSDPRIADLMLPFRGHADPEVRHGVVHALARSTSTAARSAMIEFTRDSSDEVRNWATFHLANFMTDDLGKPLDGADVREALWARRDDHHSETRAEAILGLSLRHDPRAADLVRRELDNDALEWTHYVEAAEALGDHSLYPSISRLLARGWTEEALRPALDVCKPK
jgi:HEAT repeat protein